MSGERPAHAWEQARWVWHALFHGLALVCAVVALSDQDRPARLAVAGLAAAFVAWYALLGGRVLMRARPLPRALAAIVPGVALWAALVVLHPVWFFAVAGLFSLIFASLDTRPALLATLALTALLAGLQLRAQGSSPAPGELLALLLLVAAGAVVAGWLGIWIGRIIGQSMERQQLIEQLEATRDQLARAERHQGVLQERQRLASEIHDTLAQGFTSIVMLLEAAEASLPAGADASARHLAQARDTARENLAEARQFVEELPPVPLTGEGATLGGALRRAARRLAEETGVAATASVAGEPVPLPVAAEVTLLRAAQEALANVRRHAHAGRVEVTLAYLGDAAELRVADDGDGFDPVAPATLGAGRTGGFGLAGLRRRAERLGGEARVRSSPGAGTTVSVRLPAGQPVHEQGDPGIITTSGTAGGPGPPGRPGSEG
ncbi:MAG TPA: sensor histidine kinase [Actinomycetes bacterium]|nr:sensor histidine kinase [Actinomycetes bacterium]